MPQLLTPDICVIGAGSGGLTVAAAAASFGVPVVLIEKGKMGGDCLNYGCVPSKSLIAAARHAHAMRNGAKFGIADVEPGIDFRKVHTHVQSVIAAIAPNDSVERFTALGVRVIQAEARFKDGRTVVAGDHEIRARRFVIATGSSPLIPPIPGLETVDYLTNESLFEATRLPGHLVIVGGGPVGMEMAQAYRRLGSRVTIVEAFSAMGNDDPEMAAIVLKQVRAEGVMILEGTTVTGVELRGKTGIRVHVEGPAGTTPIDGSHLLVAGGRAANVSGLDLEKAGIAYDKKGIKVSSDLRTTNRRVYAVGDVAGSLQFTHVAGYHAGLVMRPLLFRLRAREKRSILPWVTFTDPELAHVGLTEAEAARKHRAIRVLRWPFADNDRAQTERRTEGHVKVVTTWRGRILGASIVGANAGEMITLWALSLSKGMTVKDVMSYIAPYPTMSEAGKRAAITYFIAATRKPLLRTFIRFLRIFG
jgi:pyruvate/2-oxoglutarate dehydrogenase complex dihydrolipoamide dehydrogenase (E3) component